jgi:hypothetical protein
VGCGGEGIVHVLGGCGRRVLEGLAEVVEDVCHGEEMGVLMTWGYGTAENGNTYGLLRGR